MTTTIGKGADLMEVLKKKMRQAKEDTERLRDDNEELSRKLQIEVQRREAVSGSYTYLDARVASVHINTFTHFIHAPSRRLELK